MEKDENKFDNEANEEINVNEQNKDLDNEEVEAQEVIESSIEEFTEDENSKEKEIEMKEVIEENKSASKKCGFFKRILAEIINQTIILAGSLIIFFIFNLLIELVGYEIVDRIAVYFIIYVVFNLLYSPIMRSTRLNKTIGDRVVNL